MHIIKLIYTQHKIAFCQMLALTIFSGALGMITLSYINNHLLRENHLNTSAINHFLLLVMVYFIASSISQIQLARMGQQFIYTMQVQLLKRIMDTPEAQIQAIGKPKILASLASDIRSLSIAFTRLPELVQGALLTLACSIYLIYLSPKLFMVTSILMVLMIIGTHFVVKRHFHSFRAMRHSEDAIQSHYETALDGHKELKLNRYRAKRFYYEDFIPQAKARCHSHVWADSYHAIAINWGNSIMLAAVGLIFYLSTHFGWASLSDAATITMTVLFMRTPLTATIGSLPALMQSQVGWQALNALGLDHYRHEFYPEQTLPQDWQTIRLENVCYEYPKQNGQHFTLQPINFTLHRHETIFLIGSNGSGKSTLSMLLSGLYTPTSGKIFVDDIEITEQNRESYRQLFASVFTDFHLFNHIIDGQGQDVAEEAIQQWLHHLQLNEKVKIAQNHILNNQLSQGQRKRLGLLIAALEHRPIMILDEWAADQDPHFRRIFYEQLLPILHQQGYTIFAISHDDKYFHHAQRIIVMKQGKLSEIPHTSAVNALD